MPHATHKAIPPSTPFTELTHQVLVLFPGDRLEPPHAVQDWSPVPPWGGQLEEREGVGLGRGRARQTWPTGNHYSTIMHGAQGPKSNDHLRSGHVQKSIPRSKVFSRELALAARFYNLGAHASGRMRLVSSLH